MVTDRQRLLRPPRRRRLLPWGFLKNLRQGVGGPEFVLLRHLCVDRRRLDVRVAELLLDDLEVATARPIQVGRVGVSAGVRRCFCGEALEALA